jgi:hypothetical protein
MFAQVGRRTGKRPNPSGGFGKQIVLRPSAGFCEEFSWLRNTEWIAGQPAGLPTSFFVLFSFWQRKKDIVSPFQREKFYLSPVGRQRISLLFQKQSCYFGSRNQFKYK